MGCSHSETEVIEQKNISQEQKIDESPDPNPRWAHKKNR